MITRGRGPRELEAEDQHFRKFTNPHFPKLEEEAFHIKTHSQTIGWIIRIQGEHDILHPSPRRWLMKDVNSMTLVVYLSYWKFNYVVIMTEFWCGLVTIFLRKWEWKRYRGIRYYSWKHCSKSFKKPIVFDSMVPINSFNCIGINAKILILESNQSQTKRSFTNMKQNDGPFFKNR